MNAISYAVSVGSSASRQVPRRAVATLRLFRPGNYTRGTLFRTHGGRTYLVMADGEYTEEPAHTAGIENNLLATPHGRRKALILHNAGSEVLFLDFGGLADGDTGLPLSVGATITLAWTQSGASAVTASGSTEMRVSEIFV